MRCKRGNKRNGIEEILYGENTLATGVQTFSFGVEFASASVDTKSDWLPLVAAKHAKGAFVYSDYCMPWI